MGNPLLLRTAVTWSILSALSLLVSSVRAQDLSQFRGAKPLIARSDRIGKETWTFQDWFSPSSVLVWRMDSAPQGSYARMDVESGDTIPLPGFSNIARKTGSFVGWFQLSPDRKRALGSNSDGAVVISLDGKLVSTAPLQGAKAAMERFAWIDNEEWAELVMDSGSGQYVSVKFHRAFGGEPPKVVKLATPIVPAKPGGDFHVHADRHLLLEDAEHVRSGGDSYIANAALYDLDLTSSPIHVTKVPLRLPDPYITAFATAPQGTRIAWGIAPVAANWRKQILVVTAFDGTHQRGIGQVVDNGTPRHVTAFPDLRWSPDGTRLFIGTRPTQWTFAAE